MEGRGLKLDDYLKFSNKTIEDLRTEYKDSAAENVRADLVLDAVATAFLVHLQRGVQFIILPYLSFFTAIRPQWLGFFQLSGGQLERQFV